VRSLGAIASNCEIFLSLSLFDGTICEIAGHYRARTQSACVLASAKNLKPRFENRVEFNERFP